MNFKMIIIKLNNFREYYNNHDWTMTKTKLRH